MNRVRVQVLFTQYPHFGANTGFYQLFKHLTGPDISVTLKSVRDGTRLDSLLRGVWPARRSMWYKSADFSAELALAWKALRGRVDIAHYVDGEHSLGFFPGFAKRRHLPVRLIGTFHQPPGILRGLLNRETVAALDLALVMSASQEAVLHEWLPPERVRTFLYGVDTDFFRPAPAVDHHESFRCLTVGHWLRDWTALGQTVDHFQRDSGVEFHIVTDRTTGLEQRPGVVIHRHVSDQELLRLYQTADLLLLPLIDATANNSLVEGLACGLPVVSTDLPSVRAYVADASACLVGQNSPDALADAIRTIRDNPAQRLRMRRAARARAEELSWRQRAKALVVIYEELAQG